jgi:dTDP-4-amino-4,6-dideoxygalactose transaminase
MSQLQAALLNSQMTRLASQHRVRLENGKYLSERLFAVDGIRVIGWPWPRKVTSPSYHLFIFTFDPEKFGGITSDVFCEALRAEGVPCHGGYDRSLQDYDFFEDPFVQRMLGKDRPQYKKVDTPVSRRAVRYSVWLKQFQLLSPRKVMDGIVDAVMKLKENSKDLVRLKERVDKRSHKGA